MRYGLLLLCLLWISCSSPIKDNALKKEVITQKSDSKLHIIEIKKMKFIPANITVNKGDTVRFVNNDLVMHDVTEELHKSWTSSPLSVGNSWDLVVSQSAEYICSLHVVMKGKIIMN